LAKKRTSQQTQREAESDRPAPLFRRPTRKDVQTLAWQLGLSRATVHRWFGTREQLLSELLDELTAEFVETARAGTEGEGDERVFDFIRRLRETSFGHEPSRAFLAREPNLALRLVLSEDGVVHRRLAEGLRKVLAETRPGDEARRLNGFTETLVQVGTALQWATFVIGDEPRIERTIEIARSMLASASAHR
jgi:AcrR family transcriptional regulator